jgi:hypothetical protein
LRTRLGDDVAAAPLAARAPTRTSLRPGFPSRRATRLALLLLTPGVIVCAAGLPSWAQSLRRWANGDTLTAEALNTQFGTLEARIDALVAAQNALEDAQNAPVELLPDDERHDDLRWALLHAAAVGACAGASVGRSFAAAHTLPRPPDQSCGDLCTSFYGPRQQCMAAVSVGQIMTARATDTVSVGHSFRYSCDTEDDGIGEPLPFDETAIPEGETPHQRLIEGYAQYCCCGVDVSPPDTSNDGSGN